MIDMLVEAQYPDGDYLEIPLVSDKLRELGCAVVWLPDRPEVHDGLLAAGFVTEFGYNEEQLRSGRETRGGLQYFEEQIISAADNTLTHIAIASRGDSGRPLSRTVYGVHKEYPLA